MKTHTLLLCISLLLFVSCNRPVADSRPALVYFFNSPARIWEETLPLGNGRIGMMPDGGINRETFVLNEISLWSGGKQDADNPNAYRYLSPIRHLLFQGKNDEAQELMYKNFVCKGEGSGLGNGAEVPYGSFQILANLVIDYELPADIIPDAASYRRELNISDAIARVSFEINGVKYVREAFTSFSDDVGVIRLTADMDEALNFSIGMNRPERYAVEVSGNDLLIHGRMTNGTDGAGMQYAARVHISLPGGGRLTASRGTLSVKNATEAIIFVSMATDYFGKEPGDEVAALINAAGKKDYATLQSAHIDAYSRMFNRAALELGRSDKDDLPMPDRLEAFQKDKNDPGLIALYFQFGRYLLISSTRPGLLPPNLQGLWANTIRTPWNGDYHLNINLQMNLWPAEVTNLSELHMPLIEWTKQQVASGEQTAEVYYNARGWVTHILGNLWEFTAPGEHPSWGATNTSAAWLCEHLYQHYLYTQDKAYLAEVYPVMRGAALFFTDMLVEDPRSRYLVSAPTSSPENAFVFNEKNIHTCAGSTMDNQIIRELFTNTIEAARILNIDTAFAGELIAKRERLMPTTIATDGRIMEWLESFAEAEPHHRHVSHLYGLYPGNEITVAQTPALAEAARKTLEARGDKSTGWSMAWKINFWARLQDGNHALKLLVDLLAPAIRYGETDYNGVGGGTGPNLLCSHPPFQIDGNFGATAGIAEMLVQSHAGVVNFLPALPDAWTHGSFYGLKVTGGGEVAARWAGGSLQHASLKALTTNVWRIKLPENTGNFGIAVNQKNISLPVFDGVISVDLKEGDELLLEF
ncbi:MAG: glycoside hydrolase family 95 protein [Tannerellaceae bacterium]|jgi:alpha-L-fucosidase 2|nr:glycoside hydrolase family 95 protein [Tannerellaceae bacterium]